MATSSHCEFMPKCCSDVTAKTPWHFYLQDDCLGKSTRVSDSYLFWKTEWAKDFKEKFAPNLSDLHNTEGKRSGMKKRGLHEALHFSK